MANEFTAVVERDGEWFITYCPEIPGAYGQGRTKEEALENIRSAIEEYLAALQDLAFSDPEIQRVEVTL